jgi:hypothetical protein
MVKTINIKHCKKNRTYRKKSVKSIKINSKNDLYKYILVNYNMDIDMDLYEIQYELRKKNYTLYKLTNTKYCINKNENGTYYEFYDYSINLYIDEKKSTILYWDIYIQNEDKILKENLTNMIKNIIEIKKTTLLELCNKL